MKVQFNHQNGFSLDGRIFCEVYGIAENESNDELLNSGWLPSMEEKNIWYQSRSHRIELSNFEISKKRRNIIKKLTCEVSDYIQNQEVDDFFKEYYNDKGFDIMDDYNNCSKFFEPKILYLRLDGKLVAMGRYIENEKSNVFLNLAYDKNKPKLSLGTNLYYILADITKTQNKDYFYIYESYDDSFSYKQKLPNLNFWSGTKWIKYPNHQRW
jgi:hypothetical protein